MWYSRKIGQNGFILSTPTVLINNINLNSVHMSVRGQRKGGATFLIFKMDQLAWNTLLNWGISTAPALFIPQFHVLTLSYYRDISISSIPVFSKCFYSLFVIFLSLSKVFTAAKHCCSCYIITLQCSFSTHCVHGNQDHFLPKNDDITDRGAWIIKVSLSNSDPTLCAKITVHSLQQCYLMSHKHKDRETYTQNIS